MMEKWALMVEYRIGEGESGLYRDWIAQLAAAYPLVMLYEGADQPNLFVEIWPAASEEEARACQEERLSERSPWFRIGEWIPGGMEKLHAWTFKPAMPISGQSME